MTRAFIVVAILVSTSSLAIADHSQDLARAEQAYAAGDYETAYHYWLSEAEHGDPKAQEMVAAMNATGKGVPQDDKLAAEWYRKSAKQGNGSAQFSLGNMYYMGQGVSQSYEYAYAWWLIAGVNGVNTATARRKEIEGSMTEAEIGQAKEVAIGLMLEISN